jgi:hypothetical protein
MRLAKIDDYPNIKKMLENVSDTSDIMFKAGVDIDHIQGFFLLDDHGCFWCNPIDNLTLEVHATFEPGYRGKYVLDCARECQRILFTELGIERMITKCKTKHKYVIEFGKWIGFKKIGQIGDNIIMECPVESYIIQDEGLADFASDDSFPLPSIYPQEQANFAGFFILCFRVGLFMKGLQAYNRMAVLLQWQPLLLASNNPILFTVGDKEFTPTSIMAEAKNGQ